MDAHVILDLMKEMRHSGIESLEWQAEGQSLRLVRPPVPAAGAPGFAGAPGSANASGSADAAGSSDNEAADRAGTGASAQTDASSGAAAGRREGRLVASPVVGIFYAAAAPDQDPFVAPGSVVEAGAPLGIIEAMKLMNEVTSPCSGTVSEVLVENGQRVEYGQPLFTIKENAR